MVSIGTFLSTGDPNRKPGPQTAESSVRRGGWAVNFLSRGRAEGAGEAEIRTGVRGKSIKCKRMRGTASRNKLILYTERNRLLDSAIVCDALCMVDSNSDRNASTSVPSDHRMGPFVSGKRRSPLATPFPIHSSNSSPVAEITAAEHPTDPETIDTGGLDDQLLVSFTEDFRVDQPCRRAAAHGALDASHGVGLKHEGNENSLPSFAILAEIAL